jgi:Tol biopolymer transport system component
MKLFFQYSKIMVIVSTLMILLARFIVSAQESSSDLLAYTSNPQSLMLYDVDSRISIPVLTDVKPISLSFSLSKDGRLAYSLIENGLIEISIFDNRLVDHQVQNIIQIPTTQQLSYPLSWSPDGRYLAFGSPHEGDSSEIYLLDTHAANQQAINITQMPATREIPSNWSPDGRYLAFASFQDNKPLLYVWNGETSINITPEDMPDTADSYRITWGNDGELAFNVSFGYSSYDVPDEIYLWNGNKTVSLSQNQMGEDRWAVWSADGHIAFLSHRDDIYNIFGWDGESFKDGLPDIQPLFDDPSEFIGYYSLPGWTPDGLLTFTSQTAADTHAQIYVWDGETATNISQNPTLHNGHPVWSDDGRWAFTTYFSSQQQLYVRDADNNQLLMTDGQYNPAWSPIGNLAFCVRNEVGWTISVWDGIEVIEITQGYNISADWSNGNSIFCSSG